MELVPGLHEWRQPTGHRFSADAEESVHRAGGRETREETRSIAVFPNVLQKRVRASGTLLLFRRARRTPPQSTEPRRSVFLFLARVAREFSAPRFDGPFWRR